MSRRPHAVSVFLELDDPYSYLLSRYLPRLREHYEIDLRVYLVQSLGAGYKPRPDMLAEYAVTDCSRLAAEFGMQFLDKSPVPPVEQRRPLLEALSAAVDRDDFESSLFDALAAYWRGDSESVARRAATARADGRAKAMLDANARLLEKRGHYSAATLHYAGEWYWGVDRLPYLAKRLDALGAARRDKPDPDIASIIQVMQSSLPVRPPAAAKSLPPLELFCSFRSPYSYLALRRVFALADAFGLKLDVRPVLPMVMRGLPLPRNKLLYIANDTRRVAETLGEPFGRFADPVGAGVERCLAVYDYACTERKGREFLLNAGEAIWARGIDVATDKGMRRVTARCGLFWPDVLRAMQEEAWRERVESNREAMTEAGAWGVPTLRLGDFVVWGQDRLWLLARHIEERCDTGEGILV